MNTENNTTVIDKAKLLMERMFSQLDLTTANMPIEQLLTELQVVVERFTFHEITRDDTGPLSAQDVNVLLQDDISPGVRAFVEWTAEQNALKLFVNNNGSFFLSYCTRYYKTVPEVVFSSAVPLSEGLQSQLTSQLRLVHPLPARIIFKTAPSVAAGCIIASPDHTYDYSLKRTMIDNITRYTKRKFLSLEGIRG